ncbi:helix-turn-helix transcriptional regulator [Streptomyces sp. OfavH-34-F]|uniref:helix-turn-helix domain-containing protein n=1 Tax=Streptomyces sp. OfavH-34-F TaxID=2917760 RepID=UPI001EF33F1F|nr:helix-turn-helix transcriptional regulator [Streptomyces sp. OfavH-34-F]MCG7523556.1 helix-turn-helix transcriptional regulator [Streptomyces sp. OfavH-34-F]
MPASPSSSAQAAREAVAARLRELMLDARIDGKELSARCGWHPAKTSRVITGKTAPSENDIRRWCAACGAEDQTADLIATSRAVESMYQEWRRLQRNGMRTFQEQVYALNEQASRQRVYVSNVVPGFFQTPAYATALMRSITRFQGTPDDVAAAVTARSARSRFLYEGGHRFAVVIEEGVLRHRFGTADEMAGQLRHLLAVMPLASVSLGVIPFGTERTVWPLEAFYLFDDRHVVVETLTAEVNVHQPRELADYARAFAALSAMAVYGDQARDLITAAIDAL